MGRPSLYRPTNVAIAPNGDIYVGDGYGSSFINQYNQKAEFIRTFAGLGKGDDQVDCPHGLWVDTRSETPVLVVTDRGNSRLQRFTLDGKRIDSIEGTSKMPCFLDERNGDVVIADLMSKVTILDRQNKVVASLGEGEYSKQTGARFGRRLRARLRPGGLFALTALASITKATSLWWSGLRRAGSRSCVRFRAVICGSSAWRVGPDALAGWATSSYGLRLRALRDER